MRMLGDPRPKMYGYEGNVNNFSTENEYSSELVEGRRVCFLLIFNDSYLVDDSSIQTMS